MIAAFAAAVVAFVLVDLSSSSHRQDALVGVFTDPPSQAFQLARAEYGPIGAQRIYYPGALPPTYSRSACAQFEQQARGDLTCVISYKDPNLATNNAASFVRTIPAAVHVWLIFHHEPERRQFAGTGSSGQNFVADFSRNAVAIRAASGCVDCHVKVAMVANGYQYQPDPGHDRGSGCAFIPPARDVDVYLVDVYEQYPTGQPLNRSPIAAEWDDWLRCVQAADRASTNGPRPVGLAEYGLGSTVPDATRAETIQADAAYLTSAVHDLALWIYWDKPGSEWALDGHPAAVAAWRAVVSAHHA